MTVDIVQSGNTAHEAYDRTGTLLSAHARQDKALEAVIRAGGGKVITAQTLNVTLHDTEPSAPYPAYPQPGTEPEPDPVGLSWQEAWDTDDYDTIRSWYRANTGIAAAGLTDDDLTPSGSLSTTHDGQTIEGLLVTGSIQVQHDNVTIRNCKIVNSGANNPINVGYGHRNVVNRLTVDHVTCLGTDDGLAEYANGILGVYIGSSQTAPTTGMGLRASRVHISGFGGGFRLSHKCDDRVEYSMVENIKIHSGSHNTGSSFRGGTGKRHYRNWVEGSTSSAISLYPDVSPVSDWLMDGCLLDGGTYSIHGGDDKTYGGQTTGGWQHCKFTRNYQYGPLTSFDRSLPGRVWADNRHLDGEPV